MSKFKVGDKVTPISVDRYTDRNSDQRKQRDELLEVVRQFVKTMDSLPESDETSLRVWDVYDTASKLIEKIQRGGK